MLHLLIEGTSLREVIHMYAESQIFCLSKNTFCSLFLKELIIIAILGLFLEDRCVWKKITQGVKSHALTFALLKTKNKECFMKENFYSMEVSAQEKQYQRPSKSRRKSRHQQMHLHHFVCYAEIGEL